MRFPADFIEKVRDANNIVDLVAQHTQLKPSSGGYMGRCPFPDHQEKTPSFSVSEAKQVYHCFGCKKQGNIFRFTQDLMGLSFPESVEYLASRANIALPVNSYESAEQDQAARRKKDLIRISSLALEFFRDQFRRLPSSHPAKVYALQTRGLSAEVLEDFHIGYAPEDWEGLVKYLQAHQVSLAMAEEVRLIKARSTGNGYFDIFRDRLMFPIMNQMGEPIAFGGRIITSGEPKYLNSGDSPIFTKGRVLYGLAQTAKYIRAEEQVIVVEGYMDLVSLYQHGVRNLVATMGTALTADHAKMFSRLTKNIVVLFDGDEAGQHAAERSLPILLGADLHPKGLILPGDQDPDDFVRNSGASELQVLLGSCADLFSVVLAMWLRGYRGEASEKVNLSDRLAPIFSSIQDARLKSLYLAEAARRLSVDEAWIRKAVATPAGRETRNFAADTAKSAPHVTSSTAPPMQAANGGLVEDERITLLGSSKFEQILIALGLKNRNNFDKIIAAGGLDWVVHAGVKKLLEKAAIVYRQDPEKFDKLAGLLSSFVDQPDLLFAYAKPEEFGLSDESAQGLEARLLSDCLKRIRDQHLKVQAEHLTAEIRQQPSAEKLEQLMNLQRDRAANLRKEI